MGTLKQELVPTGAFHLKDNWHFWRNPNGNVCIEHRVYGDEVNELGERMYTIDVKLDVDAYGWCSIIASVSPEGETSEKWIAAKAFHGME